MSDKANYFKIGIFVIVATVAGVVAIVILGAGALFQNRIYIETYIQESVQGLEVGSPFKFRGVQIGKVERIELVTLKYPTEHRYIRVVASLLPEAVGVSSKEAVEGGGLKKEIKRGLRVRLASQGLTGTAYIEADYLESDRNPLLPIDWKPVYPYIPSAPSTITRLSESLERIMYNLEQINLQGLTTKLERSLNAMSKTMENANIENIGNRVEELLVGLQETNRSIIAVLGNERLDPIFEDVSKTVAAARRIAENTEKPVAELAKTLPRLAKDIKGPLDNLMQAMPEAAKNIKSLAGKLDEASGELPEALVQLKRTLKRLDQLISSQQRDIGVAVENFRIVSQNLKELSENAKRHPSRILFGGPPEPVEKK